MGVFRKKRGLEWLGGDGFLSILAGDMYDNLYSNLTRVGGICISLLYI